jgi:hypothetical protein
VGVLGGSLAGEHRDHKLPSIGNSDLVAPSMLIAKSLNGPWTVPSALGSSSGGASCNNPGAYIFPNGTVILICKVFLNNIRQMQVSVADSWKGPYRIKALTPVYGEDAFIWRATEDGNFHMVLHAMHPSKICTTAWSPDGISWTPAFVANENTTMGETYPSFSHEIPLTDGSIFSARRRERHQLAFDADGNPTHLLNGVSNGIADFTFTSIQPIRTKATPDW